MFTQGRDGFGPGEIFTLFFVTLGPVAWGAAEAFVRVVMLAVRKPSETAGRVIYVRFLRWLVAGLTFQLAADIELQKAAAKE